MVQYKKNYDIEVWKKIPNYDNYYASNLGRIKNVKTNKILKNVSRHSDKLDYMCVSLSNCGKVKMHTIHSLVLSSFVGERPINSVINHINGNKQDNNINNLEYCTQSENRKQDFINDRQSFVGEKNTQSKLKESDILEILKLKKQGLSYREIAKKYNVVHGCIQRIINGSGWKHLKLNTN